ncbi:MAG TPA: hypothetical protein VLC93_07030, partial [Myxococcota bacterium]|nr:hypothetical protein [Myxococcota bacterium]
DLVPGNGANIDHVYDLDDPETHLALTHVRPTPGTRLRPYPYVGELDRPLTFQLEEPSTTIFLRTSPNLIGLEGETPFTVRAHVDEGVANDPDDDTWVVDGVDIGEPAPRGCFDPGFARVTDARGNKGPFYIADKDFELEPEGSTSRVVMAIGTPTGIAYAPTVVSKFVTKEPFVVISKDARVPDRHLVVRKRGERAHWRYDKVAGTWPGTTIDLDVDANHDDSIDDDDENEEDLSTGAGAFLNGDDDDLDHTPDNQDDEVNGPEDEKDLVNLVLRAPQDVADTAWGELRVRQRGTGRVRVFAKQGGAWVSILEPNASESRDLWSDVRTADLELAVEGVTKGSVILEAKQTPCAAECSDEIVLRVVGWTLELVAGEPQVDAYDRSGVVEVAADNVAFDADGGEVELAVNLVALLRPDVALPSRVLPDDLTVDWEVRGPGSPQLWSGFSAGNGSTRLDDHPVKGAESLAILSFWHAVAGGRSAKAGDTFDVTVRAVAGDGQRLTASLAVRVVPGSKTYHVTNPTQPFRPGSLWGRPLSDVRRDWGASRFIAPVGSAEEATIDVYMFDRFLNPLEQGREVSWSIEGSGFLGATFDPNQPDDAVPVPEEAMRGLTDGDGKVSIVFKQTRYPSCPWQQTPALDPSQIVIATGTTTAPANGSVLEGGAPLPPVLGPLKIERKPLGTMTSGDLATFLAPDLLKRDRRRVQVWVYRESPSGGRVYLRNASVQFSSSNGRLAPLGGVV